VTGVSAFGACAAFQRDLSLVPMFSRGPLNWAHSSFRLERSPLPRLEVGSRYGNYGPILSDLIPSLLGRFDRPPVWQQF
jgi:hypothetical protein